ECPSCENRAELNPSAQWLGQAQDVDAEAGFFVDCAGALVAGEYGKLQMAIFVLASPAFGVGEQGAADAFAIVVVGDGEIGDVSVLGVAEIVLDRLQMDESDALAIVIFRDQDMRAGRLFGQVSGNIELDVLGTFAAPSPRRQFESFDESGYQAEDEIVIVG